VGGGVEAVPLHRLDRELDRRQRVAGLEALGREARLGRGPGVGLEARAPQRLDRAPALARVPLEQAEPVPRRLVAGLLLERDLDRGARGLERLVQEVTCREVPEPLRAARHLDGRVTHRLNEYEWTPRSLLPVEGARVIGTQCRIVVGPAQQ